MSDSSNLPRKPVRFIEANQELLKSQEGAAGQRKGGTDYSKDIAAPTISGYSVGTYRTPADRVNGNEIFRRYPDGMLDLGYACNKVIDALHIAKQGGPLNSVQQAALSALFPMTFNYHDSNMVDHVRTVNCRITPMEAIVVARKVAAHLAEEMNWNAGRGGGSVPGRSDTRA